MYYNTGGRINDMDNRPIGFFDSGLGGLTCIPHLMKVLPEERIIYFGDTARTPYGSKSVRTICGFATQIAEFLVENNVKMIVIACNTVSATCLTELQERFPNLPILGIIEPTARKVAGAYSESNKVGIIGTKVTIKSHVYPQLIHKFNPHIQVFQTPCSAVVPLIEEGIVQNDIMNLTLRYYLDDFILENRIDTLVLGCTHYPLIRGTLERMYPNLQIVDPSEVIVENIFKVLDALEMCASNSKEESAFYASDLSENFVNMISRIFENTPVKIEFKNLELDQLI
jgi:glutamate racemase